MKLNSEKLNKFDLINILKLKLLVYKHQTLIKLFNVTVSEFFAIDYKDNCQLFPNLLTSNIFPLNQKNSLLQFYYFIFLLKKQWFNSNISMAKFVTTKKVELDYRFTPAKAFDYKLFSASIVLGGNALLSRMKLRAEIKIPMFAYKLFLHPVYARKYFYKQIPHYIKTINFFLKKTLFKRLITSFCYSRLNSSLILPILKSVICLSTINKLFKNLYSIPYLQILKNKIILPNYKFYSFIIFFSRNLDKFNYVHRKTGLVVFKSKHAKERARSGLDEKTEYLELLDFEHYYPFTNLEKIYDKPRLRKYETTTKKYFRPFFFKKRKFDLFSKFFWVSSKFSKIPTNHKSFLNIGFILNNYTKMGYKQNVNLLQNTSFLYSNFFSSTQYLKYLINAESLVYKYKQQHLI